MRNDCVGQARHSGDADYDALRRDLRDLLREHQSQGRFRQAADGTDEERALFLAALTHSIADILVTVYPTINPHAYATSLADARTLACSVIDDDLLCRGGELVWYAAEFLADTA